MLQASPTAWFCHKMLEEGQKTYTGTLTHTCKDALWLKNTSTTSEGKGWNKIQLLFVSINGSLLLLKVV